ncbi:hypothetical protein IWX50DRAFT_337270 [Phyllosticta citricarpa]
MQRLRPRAMDSSRRFCVSRHQVEKSLTTRLRCTLSSLRLLELVSLITSFAFPSTLLRLLPSTSLQIAIVAIKTLRSKPSSRASIHLLSKVGRRPPPNKLSPEPAREPEGECLLDCATRVNLGSTRWPHRTSSLKGPECFPPRLFSSCALPSISMSGYTEHPLTSHSQTGTRTAPHIMENLHEDSSHDSSREQSEDIKTPVTETPGSSGDLNTPKQVPENAQSNRPPPPSFGLTPFLSQFQRDPNASPMNFQVQSAVPSPLNSRSNAQNMPSQNMPPQKMPPQNVPPPFITPRMPTNLDPFWEMLTGFDVINFHVNQAHSETRAATAQSQEEIFAYVGDQVDNIKSLMEEQCANHDRKMDAVERNVNCSADELEKVKKAIDTFNVNLDEQVMKPMKMLADKNNEVCSRLEKLDETMQRLERKLDDMVKTISSPPASQGGVIPNSCLPSLARPHDGPPVGYSRWHGYENLRQTAPGSQMPYTQVGQSYYNGGDSVQQPGNQNEHYNAGQGHGYDHAYSNSDRSRSGASTGNRSQ